MKPMKTPLLQSKHDELDALQRRSDELLAKASLSETETLEMFGDAASGALGLADKIEACENTIHNLLLLSGRTEKSKAFLHGGEGHLRHLEVPGSNDEIARAGDDLLPAMIRGRVRHFTNEDGRPDPRGAYRFAMFALATSGLPSALKFCASSGIHVAGYQESINEDGGYLVPEEFDATLIRIIERYGVFRQYARYTPMARETFSRPRRTSGVTAHWVDEGDNADESNAKWDRVRLTAKKLMVNTRVSSEFNEDMLAGFGDQLMFEIAYALAKKEDQAGFVGDGTSAYGRTVGAATRLLDVWTASGGAGLVLGSGNAYSELTLADFNGVKAALPDLADSLQARWFVHRAFFYSVMEKLAMAAGGVPLAEIVQGGPAQFVGYPVVFTNAMPKTAANSQVCAILGDLAMAADFGERRATTIAMSDHALFQSDEIAVRGTERVDINVHDVGVAADSTAGPIVGLVTAAS